MKLNTHKVAASRLIRILLTETHTTSIFLGYFGILLGIGFAIGDSHDHGYNFMLNFGVPYFWSAGFIAVSYTHLTLPTTSRV